MYFVSASPVIKRDPPVAYVGAVVLGFKVTNDLAAKLVEVAVGRPRLLHRRRRCRRHRRPLTTTRRRWRRRCRGFPAARCARTATRTNRSTCAPGPRTMTAVVARLPGEARARQAYFAVLLKPPEARRLHGHAARGDEVTICSSANFPWILVAGGFVLCLGGRHRADVHRGGSSAAPARRTTRSSSRRATKSGSARMRTAASSARSRAR